ncbi:hypothetical protein HanXRQr2_Chr17g0798051 [Helianthus annuus]|uniref:Uncharacterized protein n=1 Tax=Helianthus annuus TaxID=4232 RepID=A0A9K3GTU1_HELAN|nr:hypothetical protein HanXRQr2_Chr17g0798051 [Helianthus annuus]
MNEQEREIAWIRRLGSRGDACPWGPGGEGVMVSLRSSCCLDGYGA